MKLPIIAHQLLLAAAMSASAGAAVVQVDTFDTTAGEVFFGGNNLLLSQNIEGSAFRNRMLQGEGVKDWMAGISGGSLTYGVALRGLPSPIDFLRLTYDLGFGDTPLNLLGATHLVLHVTSLTGEGSLRLSTSEGPYATNPALTILGTGDVLFPLNELLPVDWDPSSIGTLAIRIQPATSNFTIALSGISVIPEPAGTLLLGLAGWVCFGRRKREIRRFGTFTTA
jgi:hypothetical protein